MTDWKPIETAPVGRLILIANAADQIVKTGVAEREVDGNLLLNVPGYPLTGQKWWTHWADMPKPPKEDAQ
jgi:hypothetical protein